MKVPIIISEISCNNKGDMAIVKEISQSADMQVGRGFSLE